MLGFNFFVKTQFLLISWIKKQNTRFFEKIVVFYNSSNLEIFNSVKLESKNDASSPEGFFDWFGHG